MAVEELKSLPPNMLEQAAGFIHSLKTTSSIDRKAILARTAGTLTQEEADEWEKAIHEDCEKVDARDW